MCSISNKALEGSLAKANITAVQLWHLSGSHSRPLFISSSLHTCPVNSPCVSGIIYLAALAGAHSVVITRWLVLAHKARLVDTRRRRRGRRAGHHLLWAGALGLHRCRDREKKRNFKASYYIRTSCLHKFLKSLKLSWKLIQQLIKREWSTNNPQPHAGHPLEPEGKLKGRHF